MKDTKPEDIMPKWIVNHIQYKHARENGQEFRVISVDTMDREFTGEDISMPGSRFEKLKIDDYYFFDFI